MAIPYNPSSFATNKTILQAIEELKNYLKQNPCYKVYYVSTAYVVGTTTYNLSDVDDPDDTMTAGDIVFFNNSYYASVTNKDTITFDIDPAVDFRGATGSTGAQGVSVTGATINASGHLIISLSDGTSIDAGYLPANYDNTVTISSTSGTLTNDEYNKLLNDDSHIIYSGGVYPKDSENLSTIVYRRVTSGSHASAVYKIEVNKSTKAYSVSSKGLTTNPEDIDSTGESAGAVLLADGDGSAEWGTVSSGYENTVSITATSGTFSDSDFAKLGYGDSTIVYTDAYSVSTVYKLKLETASILEFEAIDAASRNNLKLIDVNKTTKAYSMTSIAMITSATISSGSATSGKVLTANGSGGCFWETAGGGSGKYAHFISLARSISSSYKRGWVGFILINTDSNEYTTDTTIKNAINTFFGTYTNGQLNASGRVESGNTTGIYYPVYSVYVYSSIFYISSIKPDGTLVDEQVSAFAFNQIKDIVVPL